MRYFEPVFAMKLVKFELFLFLCFPIILKADDVPECPGTIQFNSPNNVSTIINYPTSSMIFPTDYNCAYQINVPQGWSAYVLLTAEPASNSTEAPVIQVIDFNQRVENLVYASHEPFYFIAPGGKIKLSTQTTTVNFGFSVQWFSNMTSLDHGYANVTVADTQPFLTNYFWKITQVTAETRASILLLPPANMIQRQQYMPLLRRILLFDGPNETSPCLGTAYQLWNSNRQFASTGRQVTVIPLQPMDYIPDVQLMFQDFENTKEIGEYQTIGCLGHCAPMIMDGSKSASAFSTYSPSALMTECLMNVSGTGLLSVYYGGKTESKSNLIASYYASNEAPVFPQALRGMVRTYVVTGGIATVNISQYSDSDCQYVKTDREGFITSPGYHTGLQLGFSTDWMIYPADGLYNFTLRVQDVDLSRNKSIQLMITNNKTNTLNVVYNETNPPNTNNILNGIGNDMRVFYSEKNDQGEYYISYTATKIKSLACSKQIYVLISFVLLLIF